MDRRQFFKSSALWLAGLIVAPHLKFAETMAVGIGRGSPLIMPEMGMLLIINADEIMGFDWDNMGWHTIELKNSYKIDNPDWTYRIENEH